MLIVLTDIRAGFAVDREIADIVISVVVAHNIEAHGVIGCRIAMDEQNCRQCENHDTTKHFEKSIHAGILVIVHIRAWSPLSG
jgi:hypothetical protein